MTGTKVADLDHFVIGDTDAGSPLSNDPINTNHLIKGDPSETPVDISKVQDGNEKGENKDLFIDEEKKEDLKKSSSPQDKGVNEKEFLKMAAPSTEKQEAEDQENVNEKEIDGSSEQDNSVSPFPFIEQIFQNEGWPYDEGEVKEYFKDRVDFEAPASKVVSDFIHALVEENSDPTYRSDLGRVVDEYAATYGAENAHQFFQNTMAVQGIGDYDLSSSDGKKEAVRDYLEKTTLFDQKRIESTIQDMEDKEELDEMAEKSSAYMKEYKSDLIEQERVKMEESRYREQQEYKRGISEVRGRINSAKNLAGFDLTEKDQNDLFNFGFRPNPRTGLTPYQEMRESDPDLDLKLLFLAMKGVDKKKISKDVESDLSRRWEANMRNVLTDDHARKRTSASKRVADPARDQEDILDYLASIGEGRG